MTYARNTALTTQASEGTQRTSAMLTDTTMDFSDAKADIELGKVYGGHTVVPALEP